MKSKIVLLVILLISINLFSQTLINIPDLGITDTYVIQITKNSYKEKLTIQKINDITRISFFKKTVVIIAKNSTSNESKKIIKNYNKEFFKNGGKQELISEKLKKNKKYSISDFFVKTEERILYVDVNEIKFPTLTTLGIAGQNTIVDIYLNDKQIERKLLNRYYTLQDITFH